MQRAGKTPVDLEREIGRPSDSAIGSWLACTNQPGAFALARVADALGVTVGHLLGEDDVPPVGRTILSRKQVEAILNCEDPDEMAALLPKVEPFAVAITVAPGSEFATEREARDCARAVLAQIRAVARPLHRRIQNLRDAASRLVPEKTGGD